jgi:hypothetical protein
LAIVVVGGSTKDIGKTSLVCGIISALRDFNWTAVKISGHSYARDFTLSNAETAREIVWEETTAGKSTDTARYLAAGACRALLVTRYQEEVPIEEIRQALGNDRNILFESNRIIDALRPDICIALIGNGAQELKPSFMRFIQSADALVTFSAQAQIPDARAGIPVFMQQAADQMSPELASWLRARLQAPAIQSS